MADAEAVVAGLPKRDASEVTYIGLVLNKRGALRALETQVHELGAVISASDGFGTRNQGRTSDETLEDALEIIRLAKEHGRSAQATISVAFGCPFDGEIAPSRVADLARRVAAAGPREIAIADTIGVGVPNQVKAVMAAVKAAVPGMPIRVHFHDTRNTAVANAWAGVEAGATTVDASIGGIGGCPFAPNATGNVATEDVQYMLQRSGVETGLSLDGLIDTAKWLRPEDGPHTAGPRQPRGRISESRVMSGPLAGLRVIEMGSLIAGPFCGQLMGDMGADVIKIEQPGEGDPMRQWGQGAKPAWWRVIARNKRSVALNLRVEPRPAGRARSDRAGRHPHRELPARHAREVGHGAGGASCDQSETHHRSRQRLRPDRPLCGPRWLRPCRRGDGRLALSRRRS